MNGEGLLVPLGGPKFRAMEVPEQGRATAGAAARRGMDEKSRQFRESGGAIYLKQR